MATVSKRRGKWVVDFRDKQGRRHWETYGTRKEADAALAERVREIGRGTYIPPNREKTFGELCAAFTTDHKPGVKANTWTDYSRNMRLHLEPFFAGDKLNAINVVAVKAFKTECIKRELGDRTINKCLTLLGLLFKYAGANEWMHSNPVQHVPKQKTSDADPRDEVDRVILSPEEFQRVLDTIDPKWRLIVKMGALTGLRQGELIGLRWKNVDINKGKVYVREQYTSGRFSTLKSKAARRDVPLAGLVNDLREHKLASRWKNADDLVFATSSGGPENHSNLSGRGWHPALRRAKLQDRSFHALRHTFASAIIRAGINMKVCQYLCGHSSITMTLDTYGHLLPDDTDGVAEKLAENMLGGGGSSLVAKAP